MITANIDTKKLQDYFRTLAEITNREMPVFVRGQAVSLVNRVSKDLKSTKKRIKSIRKIFAFAKQLKEGSAKGIIVHKKARERAEYRGVGWYRENDSGRLIRSSKRDSRAHFYNSQMLAVRYELGLRRSGTGSVRAGWVETLQQLDTRGKDPQVSFSKTLANPKSKAWVANISKGRFTFDAVFEHDGYGDPKIERSIQRGVDKTANDMEKHLYNKTGEILEAYK